MKNLLFVVGLGLVLMLQACGSSTETGDDDGDGDGVREWTYMVYIAGTNSLSGAVDYDLREMESVGSNADVAIVAQYESYDFATTRYYIAADADDSVMISLCEEDPELCTYDGDTLVDDVDMGDPDTLADFIEWAIGEYPAENYALVLWDHGSGWRNDGSTVRLLTKGALQDEYAGTYMSIAQIAEAIGTAETATSETIDLVRFDACLMGMYEVAYELQDLTSYLVVSEELVPGDGDPYDTVLTGLKDNPDMTPAELAAFLVTTYDTSYDGVSDTTNSAIDTSMVEALDSAVTALAAQLLLDPTTAQEAASITQEYQGSSYYDYHDLYALADYITENSANDALIAVAATVKTAVGDAVIEYANNGDSVADSYGLSIYLPDDGEMTASDLTDYQGLSCNDREDIGTTWGDFVEGMW